MPAAEPFLRAGGSSNGMDPVQTMPQCMEDSV